MRTSNRWILLVGTVAAWCLLRPTDALASDPGLTLSTGVDLSAPTDSLLWKTRPPNLVQVTPNTTMEEFTRRFGRWVAVEAGSGGLDYKFILSDGSEVFVRPMPPAPGEIRTTSAAGYHPGDKIERVTARRDGTVVTLYP